MTWSRTEETRSSIGIWVPMVPMATPAAAGRIGSEARPALRPRTPATAGKDIRDADDTQLNNGSPLHGPVSYTHLTLPTKRIV